MNSPVRAFYDLDITPLVVESGQGSLITDVDGNSYIDYCMSRGALIHGHCHPQIVDAAILDSKKAHRLVQLPKLKKNLHAKLQNLCPHAKGEDG